MTFLIAAGAGFVVGLLVGKTLHLLAEERCEYVGEVQLKYRTEKHVRCSLREGHTGPHLLKRAEDYALIPKKQWVTVLEDEEDS